MKKFRFLLTAILFAIVLCAVSACGKDIVKLSFETNGGSSIETVEVKKGESYELPVPTRTGFEFDGWFTDANFSGGYKRGGLKRRYLLRKVDAALYSYA